MRPLCVVLIMLGLAACASSGRPIDQATVASFEPGRTTYAEVVAAMGRPNVVSTLADGTKVVVYAHAQVATSPATFVPIVGLFAGGSQVQSESVSFIFGPDNVLRRGGAASQTQAESGLGAAAR